MSIVSIGRNSVEESRNLNRISALAANKPGLCCPRARDWLAGGGECSVSQSVITSVSGSDST